MTQSGPGRVGQISGAKHVRRPRKRRRDPFHGGELEASKPANSKGRFVQEEALRTPTPRATHRDPGPIEDLSQALQDRALIERL